MGTPCLTEQVLRNPAPQLPKKENVPLSTKSSARMRELTGCTYILL